MKQTADKSFRHDRRILHISVVVVLLLAAVFASPADTSAASKKTKPVYTLTVSGINSDTVIPAGGKLKIRYKAYQKAGKKKTKAKVIFSSSNKAVAEVTSGGTIKAISEGSVIIKVAVKKKPEKSKTVRIRVGTPVSYINLSGYQILRAGRKTTINAEINEDAVNKKLIWESDDSSVLKVNSSGRVTAVKAGDARITAKAADGSKVKGVIDIHVFRLKKNSAKWIAHRGLHTEEIENTAAAFRAAGSAGGFWGCECDIWETREDSSAAGSGMPVTELVINHDDTFLRTMDLDKKVRDMTAAEIRETLPEVCFFDEFLDVCKTYSMVPVVEFKDSDMSRDAVNKAIEMLNERELLGEAWLISFDADLLNRASKAAAETLGGRKPYTALIASGDTAYQKISTARSYGFSCISVSKSRIDDEFISECSKAGLLVGSWTYSNTAGSDAKLYEHLIEKKYPFYFVTVDQKPFT